MNMSCEISGYWFCATCNGFMGDFRSVADAANRHEEETGHTVEWVKELPAAFDSRRTS